MIGQKVAASGFLPDSRSGSKGVGLFRPVTAELHRELGLFARYKYDASELADYLLKQFGASEERIVRVSNELASCCSWLWFKQSPEDDRSKLFKADFCNHRLLCVNCSRRSSFVLLSRYWRRIQALQKLMPGARPYFVTLTIPNTDDLVGGIRLIRASIVKLMNRARKRKTGPFRYVRGAVCCYEVTRGKDDRWHPHAHCLFMLAPGQRIEVTELRQDWSAMTEGRQIRIDPILHQADLLEVFKYTLKVGSDGLSLADRAVAYFLLSGMHLRDAYGCFRGIPDGLELQASEQQDVSAWLDVYYRWAGSGYKRVRSLCPDLREAETCRE